MVLIMENTPPMPAKRALALDQSAPADIGPPKRISKKVNGAIDAMVSGECKKICDAAAKVGLARESPSRALSTPHVEQALSAVAASTTACQSLPPFPKDGRLRLVDLPIEKIIIARPRVDLGPANLTAETARMLVWMLLPCRGVRQPAIGTAKIFGRPYVACHPAIMRHTEHVFQPSSQP